MVLNHHTLKTPDSMDVQVFTLPRTRFNPQIALKRISHNLTLC